MRNTSGEGHSEKRVKATFKLAIAGELRPGTRLFGEVTRGMATEAAVRLTDLSGRGVYTGSIQIQFGAKRAAGIVVSHKGLSNTVDDFGLVKFDRDLTLSTSISASDLYRL